MNQIVHSREEITEWLMAGDPAIRWQVLRDLLDAPEEHWRAEQARVATNGWGAQLLSHQHSDGRWTARLYGKKWISTTYSMTLLRRIGLPPDPRVLRTCHLFLDEALRPDGGIDLSVTTGRSETCLAGMVLGLVSWFAVDDLRREKLVEYLLNAQLPDGGWNCQRDRTLEVVDPKMLRLMFPPRWRHDILRSLEHAGQTWFEMEQVGRPSRWSTLRCLGVLDWSYPSSTG